MYNNNNTFPIKKYYLIKKKHANACDTLLKEMKICLTQNNFNIIECQNIRSQYEKCIKKEFKL
jgi:hypothetical protein